MRPVTMNAVAKIRPFRFNRHEDSVFQHMRLSLETVLSMKRKAPLKTGISAELD